MNLRCVVIVFLDEDRLASQGRVVHLPPSVGLGFRLSEFAGSNEVGMELVNDGLLPFYFSTQFSELLVLCSNNVGIFCKLCLFKAKLLTDLHVFVLQLVEFLLLFAQFVVDVLVMCIDEFLLGEKLLDLGILIPVEFVLETLVSDLFLGSDLILKVLVSHLGIRLLSLDVVTGFVEVVGGLRQHLNLGVEELDFDFHFFDLLFELGGLREQVLEFLKGQELQSDGLKSSFDVAELFQLLLKEFVSKPVLEIVAVLLGLLFIFFTIKVHLVIVVFLAGLSEGGLNLAEVGFKLETELLKVLDLFLQVELFVALISVVGLHGHVEILVVGATGLELGFKNFHLSVDTELLLS